MYALHLCCPREITEEKSRFKDVQTFRVQTKDCILEVDIVPVTSLLTATTVLRHRGRRVFLQIEVTRNSGGKCN